MNNKNKITFKLALLLSMWAYMLLEKALGKRDAMLFKKQVEQLK